MDRKQIEEKIKEYGKLKATLMSNIEKQSQSLAMVEQTLISLQYCIDGKKEPITIKKDEDIEKPPADK